MKSYASLRRDFSGTLSELWNLYLHKTRDIPGVVATVVDNAKQMEMLSEQKLGLRLEGLRMLEIGAGQQLLRLRYMSTKNRVTGVDAEVILQGLNPSAYGRALRQNGVKRMVKTLARKAAGIDRAYWRELERLAGPRIHDRQDVVQGDAHNLAWPDASFDFVYSFSVFEHLEGPERCLEEAVRVLKPGGGLCIATHLYTSDSGCHDPRIFSGRRSMVASWAHLRPEHEHEVQPNAYCNRWRLAQWEELFRRVCPGVSFVDRPGPASLDAELGLLRGRGELRGYSDRELLTGDLWSLWKKP